MRYINSSGIRDTIESLVEEVESEVDPRIRAMNLNALIDALNVRLTTSLGKCCYDLRSGGMPIDLIATELKISHRAVARMTRWYVTKSGSKPLIDRSHLDNFIDLRRTIAMDTPYRSIDREKRPTDPQPDRRG